MGDLAVLECAKLQQSGWEGWTGLAGGRGWGGGMGGGNRGMGGDEGTCFYRGGAERQLFRRSRKSLQGLARRFLGEWLPLPTRQGVPGDPVIVKRMESFLRLWIGQDVNSVIDFSIHLPLPY